MKIEGCYASSLNNCSGVLSPEHILTESMLENKITVIENNVPSQKHSRVYSKNDFTANILCTRHNSCLSNFEAQMKDLMKYLIDDFNLSKQIQLNGYDEIKLPIRHDIKGKAIENWCLKTLINRCCQLSDEERPIIPFEFILQNLFERKEYEYPYGLSILRRTKLDEYNMSGATEIVYFKDNDNILMGGIINFQSHVFLIWLPGQYANKIKENGVKYNDHIYKYQVDMTWHSKNISMQFEDGDKVITRTYFDFTW